MRGWEEHAGGGAGHRRHQEGRKVWGPGPWGRVLGRSRADLRSGSPPREGTLRRSARPCWGDSVERLGSQGAEPPQDQLRVCPPPPPSGRRDSPREPRAPGRRPPQGPQRARHQGQPPRALPQPSPCPQAGRHEPATHTHTSRCPRQAKRAAGPLGSRAAADGTCSKAAGCWAGQPASAAQGQAVEAAGQGERHFTLGEPFNPSERLPPHLKDGGNTACPRGLL